MVLGLQDVKAALLEVRYHILAGLLVSIAFGIAIYVFESYEINGVAERQATQQIGEFEERFALAQTELDAASALIAQARVSVPMLKDFIDRLPLSKARNVPWMWAFVVAGRDVPMLEASIRSQLQWPGYAVVRGPGSGKTLAPVVMATADLGPKLLGLDLMVQSELAPLFAAVQVSVNQAPAEPLVLLSGDGFPAAAVYMTRFLHKTGGPADAYQSTMILRGVTAANLAASAGLGAEQSFQILDRSHSPPRPVLVSGPTPEQTPWLPEATISDGPHSLGVLLSRPQLASRPWWWLVALTIGCLATAFYAALRSGLIAGQRAVLLNRILSSTEHTLAETQRREAAFFENAGTANCETGYTTGEILRVNESFLTMLGYERAEVIGRRFTDLTYPPDVALSTAALASEDGTPNPHLQFEKRYVRKDGTILWALVNAKLYRDAEGRPISYMTVVLNIDDRKRDEAAKALLARELAHRVRNTVQLTSSLARQTAATARSVAEYDAKFHRRLAALSAAQDILFDRNWVSAPLARIAQATLKPFSPEDQTKARLSVDLPDVELPTQQAQTIAVALHELASNSSNFGALANGGSVHVLGTLLEAGEDGKQRLLLRWEEQSAKPIRKPRKSGFGTRMLMTAMPEQFSGSAKTTWRKNGFLYEAWLNLPEV